jgi:hypothetical protein
MQAVPPPIRQPRSAWLAGWVVGLSLAVSGAVLFWFNPTKYHFYPVCQFHQFTGLNCPGCGMTRAAHALLHGEWRLALRDNVLLILGLIFFAGRGIWWGLRRWRGQPVPQFFPPRWLWPLLIVALAFTLLRNLPAGAFLSP